MPAIAGNLWTLAMAKQSAKGTLNTTYTYRVKTNGGRPSAARDSVILEETDASRQQGATVVTGGHVEGATEHYLRPDDFGFVANALLGADSMSGSTTFTHTITPANATPYVTLLENLGGSAMINRYGDVRVTSCTISGSAGGVATYAPSWYGLQALFGATDPGTPTAVTQAPLSYPQLTTTIGGSAPGTVENFEINIDNNGTPIQTDVGLSMYDYGLGRLSWNGSMTVLFENDQIFRKGLTGTTSGTAMTSTIGTDTLSIKLAAATTLSVEFVCLGVTWAAVGLDPDPSGAPYRYAIDFNSQPQAAISDFGKIIVVSTTASVAY